MEFMAFPKVSEAFPIESLALARESFVCGLLKGISLSVSMAGLGLWVSGGTTAVWVLHA